MQFVNLKNDLKWSKTMKWEDDISAILCEIKQIVLPLALTLNYFDYFVYLTIEDLCVVFLFQSSIGLTELWSE